MTVTGTSGDVTFLTGYTDRTLDYTIYTQPVTVSFLEEEVPTASPETSADTVADSEEAIDTDAATEVVTAGDSGTASTDSGCKSSVSISAIALIIPAAAVALGIRKKKEN